MASGLGGERPFQSAKVVDGERRRLVEVLGNHERLGKNGRLFWHNSNGCQHRLRMSSFHRVKMSTFYRTL